MDYLNEYLPSALCDIVSDCMMISAEQQKIRHGFVLNDIDLLGEINLPNDRYDIVDLVDYINSIKRRYRIYRKIKHKSRTGRST